MFYKGNYYHVLHDRLRINEMLDFLKKNSRNNRYGYIANLGGGFGTFITCDEAKDNNTKFTIDAYNSNEWKILELDTTMNERCEEVRDYIENELKIEFDSRFYDIRKMSISDIWNHFNDVNTSLMTDEKIYGILMWMKNTDYFED